MLCDLTWSQEGIVHFTIVVSTAVWGSSSSSRICNYKLKNGQLRNIIQILVWVISLMTGREMERDSKSTEFLYAVFSCLLCEVIIYIPAAPCFVFYAPSNLQWMRRYCYKWQYLSTVWKLIFSQSYGKKILRLCHNACMVYIRAKLISTCSPSFGIFLFFMSSLN